MDGEFKIQEEKKILCCDSIGMSVAGYIDENGQKNQMLCICMRLGNLELVAPLESKEDADRFCEKVRMKADEYFNPKMPKIPMDVDSALLAQLLKILQNKE